MATAVKIRPTVAVNPAAPFDGFFVVGLVVLPVGGTSDVDGLVVGGGE